MTARHYGRVVILTGAARHLGAGIAARLAADGAAVAVNHRAADSAAEADGVVDSIRREGGVAQRFQADVSDAPAVAEMVDAVAGALGAPTLLVNNAALHTARTVAWNSDEPEVWDRTLRTNVTAGYLCCRSVFPHMVAAGGGAVVNISSITQAFGATGNLPYVVSKAAQVGLTRSLAREVGPAGVRVNTVICGAIKTDDERVYGTEEEVDARVLSLQALKFRGQPDELASVVSYLLSDDSRFVTGQSVTVDGGWVMH